MSLTIGFDIGGTNIVCGLLDENDRFLAKVKQGTERERGRDHIIGKLADMIDEVLAEAGEDRSRVAAVGIGTPGFVDPIRGVSVFAGNLQWRNVPLARLLEERIGIPVFIDNDVRMYVYGESIRGAGRGFDCVFGITLGTGLAAALVDRGELYYGGAYMAGELGHIRIEGEDAQCGCGMRGCLETVASATGIARLAKEAIRAGRKSVLRQWCADPDMQSLTAHQVSQAYDAGDDVAVEVMNYVGKQLAKGLSYAVSLLSPDVIVIGGGAALAGERLFKPMRQELSKHVYHGYWERLQIRQGQLIDDGGVIGSAAFARKRLAER